MKEQLHPEQKPTEIFLGNYSEEDFHSHVGWETKRMGEQAYDIYGNKLLYDAYPVFILIEEMENENKRRPSEALQEMIDGAKQPTVSYQVFDCGKPADCHHCNVHSSWNQSKYSSLEQAREYAVKWLYPYGTKPLEPNTPFEYGEGCFIEIRTIQEE